VCRVFATLDDPDDRLLVVTLLPSQAEPAKFITAPGGSFYQTQVGGSDLPYNPNFVQFVPLIVCDSFVTVGTLTNPVDANTTSCARTGAWLL
jgi:hypothetical protein